MTWTWAKLKQLRHSGSVRNMYDRRMILIAFTGWQMMISAMGDWSGRRQQAILDEWKPGHRPGVSFKVNALALFNKRAIRSMACLAFLHAGRKGGR